MILCDHHIHTKFSFDGAQDGSGEVSAICAAAEAAGVSEIALTDHCDIDCVLAGIYPPFDGDAVAAELRAARDAYRGPVKVHIGVELGGAHTRTAEAAGLLDRVGYDFVIGSLHNLRAYPDFSQIRFNHVCRAQVEYLMRRMLDETAEIIAFGRFHTLGHITYIDRYLREFGVDFNLKAYHDRFRELFLALIEKDIALECNTSGLRRGSVTMPDMDLFEVYRDCGGTRLTLGSDSHTAGDIGKGIEEAAGMLRALGFREQTVFRDGKPHQIEL